MKRSTAFHWEHNFSPYKRSRNTVVYEYRVEAHENLSDFTH